MKKLLSIRYSASAFNFAIFVLRVSAGILIMMHGYDKLIHFHQYTKFFINFMGLGPSVSLALCIFAEFFCGILMTLGLLTRLAAIPLLINMSVVTVVAEKGDLFGKAEHPVLFFLIFFAILFVGPGKISIDGAISK